MEATGSGCSLPSITSLSRHAAVRLSTSLRMKSNAGKATEPVRFWNTAGGGSQAPYQRVLEIEHQPVPQQVVGVVRPEVDGRVPIGSVHVERDMEVILQFLLVPARLQSWDRDDLTFHKSLCHGDFVLLVSADYSRSDEQLAVHAMQVF